MNDQQLIDSIVEDYLENLSDRVMASAHALVLLAERMSSGFFDDASPGASSRFKDGAFKAELERALLAALIDAKVLKSGKAVRAALTQRLESEGIPVEDGRVSLADKPRAVAVARQVVMANARRSKLTILVDENLECLSAGLRDSGFKVINIKKGTPDPEVMELAEGTAILTKNSKDFLKKAVKFDFDVISVENVKFIDDLPDSSNSTVTKISDAVRSSGFATQRGNFNLIIMDDGSYRMDALV